MLQEILDEIEKLKSNNYDWDYMDYDPPNFEDIDYAKQVVRNFILAIESSPYSFKKPYITNCYTGGVELSWYGDEREFHFHLNREAPYIVKLYDEDGKSLIEDVPLDPENYISIWEWYIQQ